MVGAVPPVDPAVEEQEIEQQGPASRSTTPAASPAHGRRRSAETGTTTAQDSTALTPASDRFFATRLMPPTTRATGAQPLSDEQEGQRAEHHEALVGKQKGQLSISGPLASRASAAK